MDFFILKGILILLILFIIIHFFFKNNEDTLNYRILENNTESNHDIPPRYEEIDNS